MPAHGVTNQDSSSSPFCRWLLGVRVDQARGVVERDEGQMHGMHQQSFRSGLEGVKCAARHPHAHAGDELVLHEFAVAFRLELAAAGDDRNDTIALRVQVEPLALDVSSRELDEKFPNQPFPDDPGRHVALVVHPSSVERRNRQPFQILNEVSVFPPAGDFFAEVGHATSYR